jgi:hypothetical protein
LREVLLLLKCGVTLLRLRNELKYHEIKYSDDQPRWPEGHPLGGQWRPKESEGEAGSTFDAYGGYGEAPDGTPIEPVGVLEDNPVRLENEEGGMHGGHTINRHVERTDDSLISEYLNRRSEREVGNLTIRVQEVPVGTFNSLEDANDLVNRAIRERRAEIEAALERGRERVWFSHRLGFRTGREAWSDAVGSEPYIRSTYGVWVVLQLDPVTRRDYRVVTAFPHNPLPRER